ncbi:MAG: GspH/FimT family protein, partial [Syntrophobacterales bacterium]
ITQARLNDAAAELVAGIQYARDLSVTHQRVFGLTADVGGNWFKVVDHKYKDDANPHHDSVPPVDTYGLLLHPVDKTWYSKDFDNSATHEGVSIDGVPASGAIFFYPDGHSSEGDSVFVLAFKGNQKTITVDGITGRISVQ